jgi:predicted RNA binding protein YcfA (HicA-like mRNA interferase family)
MVIVLGMMLGMPLKVSELLKLIEDDGWYLAAIKGSHRQYRHPTKKGRVTVPGKPSKVLPIGTERSILKQAGLDRR